MNNEKDRLLESIMERLIPEGPEIFREALEKLFNETKIIERSGFLCWAL